VKWFNGRIKGFWLSSPPMTGRRTCFVHFSAIASSGYRSLNENQKVEFDTNPGAERDRRAEKRPVPL